jgi:uncharacterized protein with NRDE domain
MSEPRVFWIVESDQVSSSEISYTAIKIGDTFYDGYNAMRVTADRVYHVIEYSAYETLRTENERLEKLEKAATDFMELYQKQLQSEREKNVELEGQYKSSIDQRMRFGVKINSLKEKVTKLRSALEFYAESRHLPSGNNPFTENGEEARSVLAEIGDEK